jgi:hypothetical protein
MTTLTTVGYGDMTARNSPARTVVMVQMVADVVVVGATVRLILRAARSRSATIARR